MIPFVENAIERATTPGFLKQERSSKLVGLLAFIADSIGEMLQRCITSGWPNHTNLSEEGMALRGSERMIPRRPGETLVSYAARIKEAWTLWQTAGNRQQLIDEIEGHLGVTGVKIVAVYEWDGVTSDAYLGTYPAWGDPGELDNWSRFWVYVPHTGHAFTADGVWDSPGTWDDGGVWDFEGFDWQQVQNLWFVVNNYRPAHEVPVRVRFLLEAGSFTDVDTWDGDSISLDFYTS